LSATAPDEAKNQPDIVITAARLPGPAVDPDTLPVAVQTIDGATLSRDGAPDLLRTALSDLAGVSFTDAQDNPYQPDLFYRGYEASPLGGDAQGLAVYIDGARFNQPFGDTANWDLIPDIAVRRLTLASANPAFGLNALGGALAIDLKSGRDLSGVSGSVSAGRFGKRSAAAEAGGKTGDWSFYLAGQVQRDDGWRDFSPSTVHQLYGDIGLDGGWGSVDLKLIGAETSLTGNGASPVELLAARRQSVFTWPDCSNNRYGRAQVSATLALGGGLTLRPQAYLGGYRQRTANGDLSDAEPCDGDDTLLCLEGESDSPLTGGSGAQFPAFIGDDTYAQLNRTRTRTTSYGASIQLDGKQGIHSFAIGASWDGSRSRFDAQSLIGALTDDRGFAEPQGVIDMADGPIRPVDVKNRRDDIGIYASDVVALTPHFDLSLSARYNNSRVRLADQLGTALNGRHRFERLNPAIGAVWRVSERASLYAGYAESNRAPTPAELSCADPDAPCSLSAFFVGDPDLKQVVARTWEAGVRGNTTLGGMAVRWQLGG
jgi:outer membrane receptor protein involved in Fe transport